MQNRRNLGLLQLLYAYRLPRSALRRAEVEITSAVLVNGFFEHTTLHGVRRFRKSKGPIKTCFWGMAMLLVAAGMCYNLQALVATYFRYPVYVTVRRLDQSQERPVFPAVSICNLNPMRRSELDAIQNSANSKLRRKRTLASSQDTVDSASISERFDQSVPVDDKVLPPIPVLIETTEGSTQADSGTTTNEMPVKTESTTFKELSSEKSSGKVSPSPDTDQQANINITRTTNQGTTENQETTRNQMTTDSQETTENQEKTRNQMTTDSQATAENQETTRNQMTTDSQETTENQEKTRNQMTTDSQATAENQETTRNQMTTDSQETTENQETTRNQMTTDSQATTENQETTRNQLTTDSQATAENSIITTILETATNLYSTTNQRANLNVTTAELLIPNSHSSNHEELQNTIDDNDNLTLMTTTNSKLSFSTLHEATIHHSSMSSDVEIVKCCCQCCSEEMCATCGNSTVQLSAECASQTLRSSRLNQTPDSAAGRPNFFAPPLVKGSKFQRPDLNPVFVKDETLIATIAALPEKVRKKLGHQFEDMILECKYSGRKCDHRHFESFYNPLHGNCYVFNSGWNESKDAHLSVSSGRSSGLQLLVNIEQNSYSPIIGDAAGIRVVIHRQREMAFPEDEGLTVSPGHRTSIAIRQLVQNFLSRPFGSCVQMDEVRTTDNVYSKFYPVLYSDDACQKTCYQRHVMQACSCTDAYLPGGTAFGRPNLPICSILNITQDDCKYNVSLKFRNNQLDCDCPKLCSEVKYEATVSIGDWPKQSEMNIKDMEKQLGITLNLANVKALKDNLLKVEIFFEHQSIDVYEEEPAYPIVQFLSDLGGVLGLWFGVAFFTFMEVLELFADEFRLLTSSKFSRKNSIRP